MEEGPTLIPTLGWSLARELESQTEDKDGARS